MIKVLSKGKILKNRGEVRVRLRGGLGNQLFQMSAAVSLANACEIPLKINTRDLEESLDQSRGNFLHELVIEKILDFSNLEYSFVSENFFFNRLHHRLVGKLQGNVVSTSADLLDKIVKRGLATYRLKGFFQDLRLVQRSINTNPLVTLRTIRPVVADMCRLVVLEKTVTLHIRLGDFVSGNLDILSSDYFLSAINEFASELAETGFKVVVFSDDIQGAHAMLQGREDVFFPEEDSVLSPPELLYVLSNAKNLIISKSTLAWWAGYIGHLNGNRIWSPWTDRFEIS